MVTTEYNKYIVQFEHDLEVLGDCLYGNRKKDIPGITDFTSQMIDVYNRWFEDVDSKKVDTLGESKFANFVRERKLTASEVNRLFMIKSRGFDCSASRIAEGYNRLIEVGDKLSDHKKKLLYSTKGSRMRMVKDLLLDFDGLCYCNERFKKINSYLAGLVAKRGALREKTEDGKLIPLTTTQNEQLDNLENEYYKILQEYNDNIWDKGRGITPLFDVVKRLITEKLCVYGGIKNEIKDTSFPNKFDIPRQYQRKEVFNPYYVSKDRKVEDIIFGFDSPIVYI